MKCTMRTGAQLVELAWTMITMAWVLSAGAYAASDVCNGVNEADAGFGHTCAAMTDGTLRCWGINNYGQLGDGSKTSSSMPVVVSGLSNVLSGSITTGYSHTCAVLNSGTASCWGANDYGQLGDGSTTERTTPVVVSGLVTVRMIAASHGGYHTCAVLTSGGARCWGANGSGQLGDGSTVSQPVPVAVSGLTDVLSIAAGSTHTCAVLPGGTVSCWGANSFGQLGDGSTTNRTTPVAVSGLSDVHSIATGQLHTCALLNNGTARCWGYNSYGQLGDRSKTNRLLPVEVYSLVGASSIAAGFQHTCAVLATGTARCWGFNNNRQLGDGSTVNRIQPQTLSAVSNVQS